jgi:nucleotide-binding universal stress UspA family protein
MPNHPTTIDRLIVPLDGSPESARALPVAVGLAERLHAKVDLLTVTHDPSESVSLGERLSHLARQAGDSVESAVVIGEDDVAYEVNARRLAQPGSAIVMSSHGPTRTGGVLTESLTTDLLADGAPLVVVGPHVAGGAANLPVVACLDGSPESEQVIPNSAQWASALDVSLVLVIIGRPYVHLMPGTVPVNERPGRDPDVALQQAYDRVVAEWPTLEVMQRVVSYEGSVANALAEYLDRHPTQLFAVATHVRDGLAQLIHPSVTGRIVRRLHAPVLVVPIESEPGEPDQPLTESGAGETAFKHVVVPIDPHHIAQSPAVATASKLAHLAKADVSLWSANAKTTDAVKHEAKVNDLLESLLPVHARWEAADASNIADALLQYVARTPRGILCVDTEAPGRLIDTLAPTTTGQIVRWSPRPAVLVGPRCEPPIDSYAEIAGWVDGSLVSEAVAALVGLWARALGLTGRVIHVEDPASAIPGSVSIASRYVDRLAARVSDHHGVAVAGETIADAHAAVAIRTWAAKHPDSLLVMASHGGGLSEHALGSVVMAVVRHARVPVVVVPNDRASRACPTAAATASSDRLGYLARTRANESHELVGNIRGRLEHQRAAAVDDGHAVLASVHRCRVAHAAFAERTMHPRLLDAEHVALAHRRLGRIGPRCDHDGVHAARDVAKAGIAAIPLDLIGIRIYGKHLVTPIAQPLVHGIASVTLGCTRYAGNGDALVGEKRRGRIFDLHHVRSSISSGCPR